jgi:hypothetical protein
MDEINPQEIVVTIALGFQAHGIGKSLLPLVAWQARRQLPRNEHKLKEVLERGAYLKPAG